MSSKPEYIQLETTDDIVTVKDRLAFIRGRRVLLVWPEEGTTLTRKLDLVLVQREAERRAIQLAMVTHDLEVIAHAKELGISTFETIRASERGRWKRGRQKVFIPRYHKPKNEPEPEELKPVASRVSKPSKRVSSLRYFVERLIVLLILVSVIAGTAYVALPSATISLQLAEDEISTTINIVADSSIQNIDITNSTIPAQIVRATVETTATVPTTGTQSLNSAPASGTVIFTNLTNSPLDIPQNTTVSTSAGSPILFKTLSPVNLPAGADGRAEVAVEALQSSTGGIGNVEAGAINTLVGPLEDLVTVRNLAATSGGESRSVQVVTQNDMLNLLNSVRVQLQSVAYEEMLTRLTSDQLIIIESIKIVEERNDWTTYNYDVGDVTDTLSLTMRAVVSAIVIDDRFARQITFAQLSSKIKSGEIILPDTFTYTRGPIINQDENNRIIFTATSTAKVTHQFDTGKIQQKLAGLSLDDANRLLLTEVPLAPDSIPRIYISPEGFGQMPLLAVRIQIQIGK